MASDPPISVKPGADRLAKVDAYAAKANLRRHGAILDLIDQGLEAAEGPKDETPVKGRKKAPAAAAPEAVPVKEGRMVAPGGDTGSQGWFAPKGRKS